MTEFFIFEGLTEDDENRLLNQFNGTTYKYKKDETILSNVANTTKFWIVKSGSANIVRYNYNGTRTIIERLEAGNIFGPFSASFSQDLYVISSQDTEIINFDYSKLINRSGRNIEIQNKVIDNMVNILSLRLRTYHERVEILTEKTIRDKLLAYFNNLSIKQIKKNITIPFTMTALADYLSIDRSAMMREIKNLTEEGLIEYKNKNIKLLY